MEFVNKYMLIKILFVKMVWIIDDFDKVILNKNMSSLISLFGK